MVGLKCRIEEDVQAARKRKLTFISYFPHEVLMMGPNLH